MCECERKQIAIGQRCRRKGGEGEYVMDGEMASRDMEKWKKAHLKGAECSAE